MITKEEKIKLIKKIASENDISAYELGQKTSISSSSTQKIFSGEQKNPRNKTLNILLDYLENYITGTKSKYDVNEKFATKVSESPEDYKIPFADLKIDDKLNIINQKLDILLETH